MALVLPKFVVLTNGKLNVLYYILVILVGVGLAIRFLNLKQNSVVSVPYGQVTAWAEGHHDIDRPTLEATMVSFNTTLCKNPGIYEYWWDAAGEWRQGPHKCAELCAVNGRRAKAEVCVRPAELAMQEASDMLFFVTEFGERYMDTETADRHYFVPSTDALSVGFEYSFSIYDNGPFDSSTAYYQGTESLYSSKKDILTVLVDSNEDGQYVIQPGGVIKPASALFLSIPQLMQLSGRPLDVLQPESGANMRPGASHPSGPLARMAGVELNVHMDCHRSLDHTSLDLDSDWEGPVCIAEVRPAPTWWASKDAIEVIDSAGALRKRRLHGVRVSFTVGGSYRFFDFNKVLLNFSSCLVYMSLPAQLMLLFCIYCLGHLSTMYKQAIYQRYDLVEQCAGMAARLLSMSTSFMQLQDVFGPDNQGISRSKLKERLLSVIQYREDILDESELERLVNFCFHTLVSYHTKEADEDILRLRSLVGKRDGMDIRQSVRKRMNSFSDTMKSHISHEVKTVAEDEVINVDDFSVAHASIEPFSFVSFLELFDVDRPPTRAEKFFMPRNVRVCREETEEALLKSVGARNKPAYQSPLDRLGHGLQNLGSRLRSNAEPASNQPMVVEADLVEENTGQRIGKSEKGDAERILQEPSPEPAAIALEVGGLDFQRESSKSSPARQHGDLARQVNMLESSLKQCQDKISDSFKTLTARLDRLEGGLTGTKKRIDLVEALTGHHTGAKSKSPTMGRSVSPTMAGVLGRSGSSSNLNDTTPRTRSLSSSGIGALTGRASLAATAASINLSQKYFERKDSRFSMSLPVAPDASSSSSSHPVGLPVPLTFPVQVPTTTYVAPPPLFTTPPRESGKSSNSASMEADSQPAKQTVESESQPVKQSLEGNSKAGRLKRLSRKQPRNSTLEKNGAIDDWMPTMSTTMGEALENAEGDPPFGGSWGGTMSMPIGSASADSSAAASSRRASHLDLPAVDSGSEASDANPGTHSEKQISNARRSKMNGKHRMSKSKHAGHFSGGLHREPPQELKF